MRQNRISVLFSIITVIVACGKDGGIGSSMYNEFFEKDFTIESVGVNDAVVSFVAHYPEDTDGYIFSTLVSTEESPAKDNGKLYRCSSSDKKTYSVTVDALLGGKEYYCRPAVEISPGVYKYGPIKSFTTKAWSAKVGTKGVAIDLGLSVKWADHNIGASSPEELGGYYAWGETEEKNEYYDWNSYIFATGDLFTIWDGYTKVRKVTKYCSSSVYGEVDNKKILEPVDDVANVKWGDGWSIPTFEQWIEFFENTTFEKVTVNGVIGHRFTSKINSKTIFFPASFQSGENWMGRYWTSTLDNSAPYMANFADLGVGHTQPGIVWSGVIAGMHRASGLNVRAVFTE